MENNINAISVPEKDTLSSKKSNQVARLKRELKTLRAQLTLDSKTKILDQNGNLVFTKSLIKNGTNFRNESLVHFANSNSLLLPIVYAVAKTTHMFAKGGDINLHPYSKGPDGKRLTDGEGKPIEGPSRLEKLQQIVDLLENNKSFNDLMQSKEMQDVRSQILAILNK